MSAAWTLLRQRAAPVRPGATACAFSHYPPRPDPSFPRTLPAKLGRISGFVLWSERPQGRARRRPRLLPAPYQAAGQSSLSARCCCGSSVLDVAAFCIGVRAQPLPPFRARIGGAVSFLPPKNRGGRACTVSAWASCRVRIRASPPSCPARSPRGHAGAVAVWPARACHAGFAQAAPSAVGQSARGGAEPPVPVVGAPPAARAFWAGMPHMLPPNASLKPPLAASGESPRAIKVTRAAGPTLPPPGRITPRRRSPRPEMRPCPPARRRRTPLPRRE